MSKNHSFVSDAGLRRITPPKSGRETWKYAHCPGLTLNVSHTGLKVWYGVVRNQNGKADRCKLGHYLPDADGGLSLAKAAGIVERARHRARAGLPPWEEFRGQGDNTFARVRERFMEVYVDRNLKPNTQTAYRQALFSDDLKNWSGRTVQDITKADVNAVLDVITQRGALVQANRTLAYLRKFFNWCAEKDLLPEGQTMPTDRVKPPLKKERARDRWLTADELRLLWRVTEGLDYPFFGVIRLLILTGQRISEVASMRWQDIDLQARTWTQTENKAGRLHVVPLNDLALAVLEQTPRLAALNRHLVFTTTGKTPPSGFGKIKGRLNTALEEAKTKALADGQKIEDAFVEPWQYHDLRRTMTTHLRRLGVSQHICGGLLNHAERGVTAIHYDHYDELPEKTRAMQTWGHYVSDLVHGKRGNVVEFKKAGADGAATPPAP